MKQVNFSKKRLAVTISMLLGTGAVTPSYAAEDTAPAAIIEDVQEDDIEVIEVSGMRGSLVRSSDLKRESSGVVDAISSEEMGKFPDTNLAESLQRITGVTVSRANGEGSQITVRGFGPSFNLVTLNGRQMPGTGNSRSYNLENISSEGVSTLEVIKTARADTPTGGLGATVNIITTRPLDSPGLKYSISGKAINDTSNEEGDDVTPEIAGIFSNTFADETFGVAFSFSHQERDFQQQGAQIDGWQADVATGAATGEMDNRPEDSEGNKLGHTFFPRNLGYNISNVERTRDNGQLTLQYAPTDNFVATVDYTASKAETATESMAFGVWFVYGGNINEYELDENGTAVYFNEANNDYAHTARQNTTEVEAESIGLNLEWQVTENLGLELDFHNSTNDFDDGADSGSGSNPFLILGANNLDSKSYSYQGGDVPQIELFWPNGAAEANPSDYEAQFGEFGTTSGESEIDQLQIDGIWENPYDGFLVNIKFGASYTDQTMQGRFATTGQQGPVGYASDGAVFPDSMFTRTSTGGFLDELSGGGSNLTTDYYYDYNFDDAVSRMDAFFPGFETNPWAPSSVNPNHRESYAKVQEETTAVYAQAALYFDVYDFPVDINFGFRYEETDVTSTVRQNVEDKMIWISATEWNLAFEDGFGLVETTGEHDVFLPSFDIKVDITDEVVGRFSAGKTISRAPLGNLAGVRSLSPSPKPGSRTGSSGNTNLQPFESTNIDLSLEYYYAEGSYASIGWFQKDVKNFISNSSSEITVDGLRDPWIGPRAEAARAELGAAATTEDIFDHIIANGGGNALGQVEQADGDPLTVWDVSQPSNGDTKKVDGIEVAVQHFFGESGFGTAINATFVDGDVEYDVDQVGGAEQSPLTGLSDSANFQAFYEKDGLSVKITYAWRDEYLIGVGQSGGSADAPPQFAKEYGQWDASVNYDITDQFTVFLEGVNLNNETEEAFGRYEEQFLFARQYGPRYTIGARYTFK
ncbi:TonB-dependent receptor [Colwelliaceae bacterium BS250]